MKSVSINGIARVNLGKSFAKQLRKKENVPCVIYGGNEQPIHFFSHVNDLRKIIYTAEVFLIDVTIAENTIRTMMGDIQFHPVTDKILHIDFLRIFDEKKVRINVPIHIMGNAIGVRNGGRFAQNLRKLYVEAFAQDLPEKIVIDITALKIGEAVRISDLQFENVTFLNNLNDVVVAVKTARTAILEEEEVTDDGESQESDSESTSEASGSNNE